MTGTDATSTAFVTQAPKLGFLPSFDGMRGVLVMLVLLQHAYPVAESITIVVDGFFIISAFLITTLLLEEHKKTDRISLKNFYARRGLRLLPALAVTLVVGFVLFAIFAPDFRRQAGLESLATFFYVHNIFFTPLLGVFQVMGQMWTLSVEEQFYFVVSIGMFLLVPRTRLKAAFTFLALFYIGVNVARLTGHMGPGQAWFQRPDACAIGMMVAIVNAWIPPLGPQWTRRLKVIGVLGTVMFVVSLVSSPEILRSRGIDFGMPFLPEYSEEVIGQITAAHDRRDTAEVRRLGGEAIQHGLAKLPNRWYWVRWGFTLGGLGSAMMIFALARLRDLWSLSVFLSWSPIRFVGRASYALYICHYQLYLLLDPVLIGGAKARAVQKIAIALVVGSALHHWIEKPGIRLKQRFSFLSAPSGAQVGS